MKGIVLAGGHGTRLHPITRGVSKQLLPIYDKPMVYYPISILMLAGIRDILIITTPDDQSAFKRLLGDGSDFGINLGYQVQRNPEGLAQAFILGESFVGEEDVCLVLGDNIFYGQGLSPKLKRAVETAKMDKKATVFGYQVKDPNRYGVVEFNEDNLAVSIEEKPVIPKSNYAITGLYFYPNSVIELAKTIRPSGRNELEISCINNDYLQTSRLIVEVLGRGFAWLDTGTNDSLVEASQFVHTVEHRQGYKIACLEEIAYANQWLSKAQLKALAKPLLKSGYGSYLMDLISD
jgi:glucose-1-phosphate thymidylyltransferase